MLLHLQKYENQQNVINYYTYTRQSILKIERWLFYAFCCILVASNSVGIYITVTQITFGCEHRVCVNQEFEIVLKDSIL